ncbi:uncharacterized protein LOC126893913 isoform X2 [Daktulosphaira vitifoliae]|uniref:uncharacterized protein LOC126893913 isoform X2 n=1 Tax=Daktulosphaira vitifoliae TaxID=58002 RepID=UPI0021AA15DD|nr:uncharacterized protein LOC126893913 isoform X2 [Daktulosphaira vitifoliae]
MKFLSYLDVRYVFKGSIVPNVIIDEIDFFQQYVLQQITETSSFDLNSIPKLKDSETKFKNLNEFYTEALEKECSNGNDSYLVYLTCSKLNLFYIETIEIWYKNLGFKQFLNPNTPEFIPPMNSAVNQYDGIKVLNILRQENGWKTMNHINIIYNGKQYTVDCVMKDPIDHMNFQIKKEHVTQLLRCRYTEIMKNYHVLLSAILFLCNKYTRCIDYNCIIKLFDSFNKSIKMLEGLNRVLITLKKYSIWNLYLCSHSSLLKILKWIEDFIYLSKNNEFSNVNFYDNQGHRKIDKINKLLKIFLNVRKKFYLDLNGDIGKLNIRCSIKNPFYDKNKIINELNCSASTSNNPFSLQSTEIYINVCNYFDDFCEKVYKSCYENLGFSKIDCLNNN